MSNKEVELSDRIAIEVNGATQEIVMTGGLISLLTSMVPNGLGGAAGFSANAQLQDRLARYVLAPRDAKNRPVLLSKDEAGEDAVFEISELDIPVSDYGRLIDWIGEHLMSFFTKRLIGMKKYMTENPEVLQSMEELVKHFMPSLMKPQTDSADS